MGRVDLTTRFGTPIDPRDIAPFFPARATKTEVADIPAAHAPRRTCALLMVPSP